MTGVRFQEGAYIFSPERLRVQSSTPFGSEVTNALDVPPLSHTSSWRGA